MVQRKMKIQFTLLLIILLQLFSCKSIQIPADRTFAQIPNQYTESKDSTLLPTIQWKTFFADRTLVSLIDSALQNNFNLMTAYQNIEIAKVNLRFSKGMLIPTVSANAIAGLNKYGNYTQEWAGNSTTIMRDGQLIPQQLPDYLLGFSASWEADIWGKLKNQKQAAQSRYLASVEGKNWLQTNLIAEIANQYFELLAIDNQIEILKETIALQEKSLALIKIQKEAGRSNALAVKQFEAQILNTKASAKLLTQTQLEIENNINLLAGRYPQKIERTSGNFEHFFHQKISEGIPSQLLENRPDIRMAGQELLATRFDLKSAKKAFYPSLNINSRLAFNAYSPDVLFSLPSVAYNIFGGLSAPLLNRSAIQAAFKTASVVQQSALFNYQKSIVTGFTEVYNQVKNMENLKEVYDLKNQEVNALDTAISFSNLLFQTNRADYLEVLLAQQNFQQAKLDLMQYRKQQRQSFVNLYKTLGGGWR
jgi:NodT family efflux transporter outer membrane factor (OMF) lipoprotein